jgi:hypothetical protein
MRGIVAAIVAGVVLIALIWVSVAWFAGRSEQEEPVQSAPAPDTTRTERIPPPEPVVLPDTFAVHVIARDERLDPIRSRVDDDLRRPFWVELGDTLTFRAANSVVLEREVEHAVVLVEEYLPPADWLEPDGRYAILRDRTQAWFDSLAAAGVRPPAAPDTIIVADDPESAVDASSASIISDAAAPGSR